MLADDQIRSTSRIAEPLDAVHLCFDPAPAMVSTSSELFPNCWTGLVVN